MNNRVSGAGNSLTRLGHRFIYHTPELGGGPQCPEQSHKLSMGGIPPDGFPDAEGGLDLNWNKGPFEQKPSPTNPGWDRVPPIRDTGGCPQCHMNPISPHYHGGIKVVPSTRKPAIKKRHDKTVFAYNRSSGKGRSRRRRRKRGKFY